MSIFFLILLLYFAHSNSFGPIHKQKCGELSVECNMIDKTDEIIYVSDIQTHELLFINPGPQNCERRRIQRLIKAAINIQEEPICCQTQ